MGSFSGGNINGNIFPNSTGFDLGSPTQRWDGFFQDIDISRNVTLSGTSGLALRGTYNVKDFGAIGNGVTDDTTAIQLAITTAQNANGGIIFFPPGKYLVSSALQITNNGITLHGSGCYPSSTVKGTQIFSNNATGQDIIWVNAASNDISNVAIRDLYTCGPGQAASNGNGIHIDASVNTISRIKISNVWSTDNRGHGVYFHAGQGSGGFIFDCVISELRSIRNGGSGFKALGRVSQIHAERWYIEQNTGDQVFLSGGSVAETQDFLFNSLTVASELPVLTSVYGLRLDDTASINVFGLYTESLTFGNVLLKSARRTVIFGGSISQTGSAKGIVFDNGTSGNVTDDVIISIPGWSNTSSETRITRSGGSVREIHLGLTSDGKFSSSDITGTFSPTGEVFIDSSTGVGPTVPVASRVGDLFFKNTAPIGLQQTIVANTFNPFVYSGSFSNAATKFAGVVDGSAAAAGNIGEYMEMKQTSAQSLTTATYLSLGSLSLTAGDWDVQGNVAFTGTSTTATAQIVTVSTANNNDSPFDNSFDHTTYGNEAAVTPALTFATPVYRVSISGTTSYYLVVRCSFGAGTALAQGTLRARRVR